MTSNPSISFSQRDIGANALVLCVDDDAAILDITKEILEVKGFSVIAVLDWRQAIEVVKSNPVDLVILDYEMPELKGHEVAMLIRRVNPAVPLILYSGASTIPEVATKATDAFIQKGTEPSTLVATINNLIVKNRSTDFQPSAK
jgi:DNA-binding NtrC family response regulator